MILGREEPQKSLRSDCRHAHTKNYPTFPDVFCKLYLERNNGNELTRDLLDTQNSRLVPNILDILKQIANGNRMEQRKWTVLNLSDLRQSPRFSYSAVSGLNVATGIIKLSYVSWCNANTWNGTTEMNRLEAVADLNVATGIPKTNFSLFLKIYSNRTGVEQRKWTDTQIQQTQGSLLVPLLCRSHRLRRSSRLVWRIVFIRLLFTGNR